MRKLQQLGWILIMFSFWSTSMIASTGTSPREQSLVEVLDILEKEYNVVFSYNTSDIKKINVQFEWKPKEHFEIAINRALTNTGLKYKSVGLNFYILYRDNDINKRKLKKINRKIKEIRRLSKDDEFMISEKRSLSKPSTIKRVRQITGKVLNASGEPMIGATVIVTGDNIGTICNEEGSFELQVPLKSNNIEISYTGYHPQKINIKERQHVDVQLQAGLLLQSVTVMGSRGAPRTRFDSAVPIDHVSATVLSHAGKSGLDEQLNFAVPSFASGQHPVSDATALFNPVDLRGLLPSRTLILINGKRKNKSALLYSYVTASRGEVGVDLKSINSNALSGVEILRDGAAAQYGSDAIAGVVNLQLKKKIEPYINTGYSITGEGDGVQYQATTGFSFDITEKGYAAITLGYHQQNRSQRAGNITSAEDEANFWGTSVYSLSEFQSYLQRNPKAGFQVGLPDMTTINASVNAGYMINEASGTELYGFGSTMNRKGNAPQFARGPYWVSGFESIYPDTDYFLPEIAPVISDEMMTIGLKHNSRDWLIDLSSTYGNSRIDYHIHNSFNQSLGQDSPKNFYNGAHRFYHFVNNLDVNKTFYPALVKQVNIAFGAEQRIEFFRGYAGEFASYGDGTPNEMDRVGSESFSGLSPQDAVYGKRNNIGFYSEVSSDVDARIHLAGAARYEHYSDFGDNLSWKVSGLYKALPNKLNLRMSISNGFRAPALHQIHFTSTTTTLTPQGVVQNRILNNLDPSLDVLGIPKLKAETSFNLGAGFTYKVNNKINVSFDSYQINVNDRIVLSGQIGRQDHSASPINTLLNMTNTSSVGFFLNAVNTTTRGIDVVVNLQDQKIGNGKLSTSLAANINNTKVNEINLPEFINNNNLKEEIFSREDISRIESWRPQEKIILSTIYKTNKYSTTIDFTHFGAVTYRHSDNPINDATYGSKVVTNVSFTYNIGSKINWQVGVNNLFNVYPDSFKETYNEIPDDRNIDFVGRFQYPWQTLQIGIDGIRGYTKLTMNF